MHLSRRFILRVLFSFVFFCSSLIAVSQDNAPDEVIRGYQLFESKEGERLFGKSNFQKKTSIFFLSAFEKYAKMEKKCSC